jgi:hypothetical protein
MYTLSGRRAAVLLNSTMAAGSHSLVVPLFGKGNNRLGNGTYIIRLTIDGKVAVNTKMLYQK